MADNDIIIIQASTPNIVVVTAADADAAILAAAQAAISATASAASATTSASSASSSATSATASDASAMASATSAAASAVSAGEAAASATEAATVASIVNTQAVSTTYIGGILSKTLKFIIGILPTGEIDFRAAQNTIDWLASVLTEPILSTIRSLTATSAYYTGGIMDRAGNVIIGFLSGNFVDFRPGPKAFQYINDGLRSTPYVPTPLDPSVLVTLKQRNGVIQYGESTSIGVNGQPAYNTTPSLNGHLTFDVSVKMTAPSISPPGSLPDNGLEKALVEDDLASEVGNTQGSTGLYAMVATASAFVMKALGLTAPPVQFASTAGKGGATMAVLFGPGSTWIANWNFHLLRQKQLAAAAGQTYALQCIPWIHTANDQKDGTSYNGYLLGTSGFRAFVAYVQATAANPVHFLCITSDYNISNNNGPSFAVTDEATINNNPVVHLVIPGYYLQMGPDATHYTQQAYDLAGSYIGRAYQQVISGFKPSCLTFNAAYRRGNVITVFCNTPAALQIDYIGMPRTQDAGFKVLNGSTPLVISSITAWSDYITIVLSSTPTRGDDLTLNYALDYLGNGVITAGGASGNVCDTTLDFVPIDGVMTPMPYVLFPFTTTVKEVD